LFVIGTTEASARRGRIKALRRWCQCRRQRTGEPIDAPDEGVDPGGSFVHLRSFA
jgi:hypothetical protein